LTSENITAVTVADSARHGHCITLCSPVTRLYSGLKLSPLHTNHTDERVCTINGLVHGHFMKSVIFHNFTWYKDATMSKPTDQSSLMYSGGW